jgi:hypothetical protein
MKLGIDALEIRQSDLLPQYHLVKANDKVRIKESAMENAETETATDKLEVVQMLRVNTRGGVDLQCVVVVRRVLEETIEWVEHLVREYKEEFSVYRSVRSKRKRSK